MPASRNFKIKGDGGVVAGQVALVPFTANDSRTHIKVKGEITRDLPPEIEGLLYASRDKLIKKIHALVFDTQFKWSISQLTEVSKLVFAISGLAPVQVNEIAARAPAEPKETVQEIAARIMAEKPLNQIGYHGDGGDGKEDKTGDENKTQEAEAQGGHADAVPVEVMAEGGETLDGGTAIA